MQRLLSIVALAAGIVVLLSIAACSSGTAGERHTGGPGDSSFLGDAVIPPLIAPPFTLEDYDGSQVSLRDLKGKLVLLSFSYTHCPDVCPLLGVSFGAVQEAFPDEIGGEIALVFISLDPEGDTPEARQRWSEALGGQWHYLSGERGVLERLWDVYGVFVEPTSDGFVGHGTKTYLIDRQGLVILRYGGVNWDSAAISDISQLLGG